MVMTQANNRQGKLNNYQKSFRFAFRANDPLLADTEKVIVPHVGQFFVSFLKRRKKDQTISFADLPTLLLKISTTIEVDSILRGFREGRTTAVLTYISRARRTNLSDPTSLPALKAISTSSSCFASPGACYLCNHLLLGFIISLDVHSLSNLCFKFSNAIFLLAIILM